jgi:hypothetical protein
MSVVVWPSTPAAIPKPISAIISSNARLVDSSNVSRNQSDISRLKLIVKDAPALEPKNLMKVF